MTGPTRRQVVIGIGAGGGAIVLAGAGVAFLHSSGRGSRYSPPPSVGVAHGDLRSVHMKRTVGWTISTPAVAPRATVYCLHGFGGDNRFAFDTIRLADVVASLGAPLAVAAVDGGPDSYWHPRSDGTDALAMLLDEFLPFVEQRTRTQHAALLGWSMGGYGCLLAAQRTPSRFFAVAVASPALWTSAAQTVSGAFDGAADYHRFDVYAAEQRLRGITLRVDCGTSDPFYQATLRFVSALPPGHQGSFGPGAMTPATGAVSRRRRSPPLPPPFRRREPSGRRPRYTAMMVDQNSRKDSPMTWSNAWHRHPGVRSGDQLTLGERAADKVRNGMGSWPFVIAFLTTMGVWAVINSVFYLGGSHGKHGFDPYPYILLNLMLSMVAGLQGAILLIAAKRADQISSELAVHTFENTNGISALLQQNTDLTKAVEDLTTQIHRTICRPESPPMVSR